MAEPALPAASQAFGLLDERVQRWIWQQRWSALHDVQEEAIPAILAADRDIILSAATASGKTEAAFLPICTRLAQENAGGIAAEGIQVIYVSPLKALINDQFRRLDGLCENLEIPVHRWHGDVPQSAKRRLLEKPTGILLITPESLEAFFVLRGTQVARLFGALSYVVADEVHALIGTERGRQLQSLLHRVDMVVSGRVGRRVAVPRIGLSATLGDMSLAAAFLRPGSAASVTAIVSRSEGQEILAQVRGYEDAVTFRSVQDATLDERVDGADKEIAQHLFRTLRDGHHLVFANARRDVEEFTDLLATRCADEGVSCPFLPHHGSLSRELREDAEVRLKDAARPATAICTSTLELGIDIGAVESVAQIGVPPSVAALRQRLGRSGRRAGDPCRLRMYAREAPILADTPLPDMLRLSTVQMTVMLQLLVEGWYEPPEPDALHLSTLVQQTLSVIAERSGCKAPAIWALLCQTGPFRQVGQKLFAQFLQGIHAEQLISQMEDGTLLLGPAGERLVQHYSFYAAFATPEEYRLVAQGRTLGTLPVSDPLIVGSYMIYGGRRWQVLSVDEQQHVVELSPARGGKPPHFGGGGTWVHGRVRKAMRSFYENDDVPSFLDSAARRFVTEGREHFLRFGLHRECIVPSGANDTRLFLWDGDRAIATLRLELIHRGVKAESEGTSLLIAGMSCADVRTLLEEVVATGLADPLALAAQVPNTISEKHDQFIPETLRISQYANRYIRTAEARQAASDALAQGKS